ncbi:hypothetical protein KSP39_PZI020034 [Platanthera zijinensis]|uniref:Myb-like domain-containing protein n=1 Tax=Platanthera zijinensis TaxID=2320716 RepID=A0AAP0B0G5_9ASPA
MASTVLPWQWVIESLAGIPDVETSILSALVDRFPFVLGDSSSAVRERLALRYVEECAGMACGETPPAVASNITRTMASAGKIDPFKTCEEVLRSKVASANDHAKGNADLDDGDLHQLSLRKRVALQKSSIELLKENILGSYVPDFSYSKEYNSLAKKLRCRVSHLNCSSYRDQNGIKKMINTMKCASPLIKRFTLISKYRKLTSQANTSLKSVGGASQEDSNPLQHLDNGKRNQQTNVDDACNGFQVERTRSDLGEGSAKFHDVEIQSPRENLSGNVSSPNITPDNLDISLSGLHDLSELQVIPEDCEDVQILEQCSMPQPSSRQRLCIKCCSSGQLLNCCGDGCSRAIHERCLGLLDCVERTDLFYCPFCSYKNARMMFEKSKIKVEDARRNLLSFYDIDPSVHAPKGRISVETMIKLNKNEHPHLPSNQQFTQENIDTQNHETSDSKFTGDINQEITQNEQNHLNVTVDINCKSSKETIETFTCQEVQDTPMKLNIEAGNEHESTRVTKYQQPVNDLGISGYDGLSFELRTLHERNDDDICVNSRSNVATSDHLEIRNAHTFAAEKEQLSIKPNQRSILKGKGRYDHKAKRKALASKIKARFAKRNKRDKASLTGNYDGATENKKTNNSSSRELRKTLYRQNICSSQKEPSSRRLMLNWTAEEEKILEEAMEKIPQNDGGSMPWIKILEYGHHAFHESRTTVDLKDKWRNMQKRKAKRRG